MNDNMREKRATYAFLMTQKGNWYTLEDIQWLMAHRWNLWVEKYIIEEVLEEAMKWGDVRLHKMGGFNGADIFVIHGGILIDYFVETMEEMVSAQKTCEHG